MSPGGTARNWPACCSKGWVGSRQRFQEAVSGNSTMYSLKLSNDIGVLPGSPPDHQPGKLNNFASELVSPEAFCLEYPLLPGKKCTPPCRVLLSFEPAFAGWSPPQMIRLGRSLSRHTCKIEPLIKRVGSKPGCDITSIAGQLFYTTLQSR